MKITDLKVWILQAEKDNWVYTKIYTDEGITGVGECSVEGRELTVKAAVEELRRYLIGADPFETEKIYYRCFRDGYWGAGAILTGALSAVDGALWDIKGKALGVPVYQLLGGKIRDSIRVYANRWFFGANTPEELASRAVNVVKQGYTAMKWDPFGRAEQTISHAQLDRALTEIAAVRDAVGPQVDLLIEGHGRFNIRTATEIAREIAPFKPMFFEEPVMPENIDALRQVHDASPVAIAAGERYYTQMDFRAALEARAVDYLQPDLRETGGLTQGKRIATLAESFFVPIAPHNIHGQIGTAMSLHLCASSPNACILEFSVEDVQVQNSILTSHFRPENGMMKIPDTPGLGIDLNEEEAERYPYRVQSMIESMFD